jgi:hypothetical protein
MTTQSVWRPEEAPLRQLITILYESLSGKDPTAQRKAELVSPLDRLIERHT